MVVLYFYFSFLLFLIGVSLRIASFAANDAIHLSTPYRVLSFFYGLLFSPLLLFYYIYRAIIATTRSVYSTYISGTLKGEPFIWARIETNSAASGSTKLYFEDGFTSAVKFLGYTFSPTTIEKTSEGTYRIHNRVDRIITYSTEYKEEQIGFKRFGIANYEPAGDYHRISLPAILSYAPTSYNAQFYENGWIRFTIYSYSGTHMVISFPDPNWGYIAKDDGSDYSFDKMFREDLSK